MTQEAVSLQQTHQLDALTLEEVLSWGLHLPLLILTVSASLWSLCRRRKEPLAIVMFAWAALLFVLATPELSGLPPGFITYRTVIIALYIPSAVVVGLALSALPDLEVRTVRQSVEGQAKGRPISVRLHAIAGVALLLCGVHEMAGIRAMPRHELVRNVDLKAIEWIRENTPPDALFAVEPLFYLPWAAAGNDAGYWLPYIGRRPTILPPMVYTADGTPQYVEDTNAMLRQLLEVQSSEDLAKQLHARGVRYIYVTGPTEHSWKEHALDHRFFEVVYHLEDVRIVRLRQA